MKSKAQSENKALISALHKTQSKSSALVDKSKLDSAVKTLSAVNAQKKSNTIERKNSENKKTCFEDMYREAEKDSRLEKTRDIKAFIIEAVDNDKLSKFEQRAYMHKSLDNNKAQLFLSEDKSEHKTVFFNKATNKFEALSKDIAKEQIRAHMLTNSATKRIYRTSDFQQLLQSASSSYTDMIRSACSELHREKFLLMSKIQDTERTRAKYQYELLKK